MSIKDACLVIDQISNTEGSNAKLDLLRQNDSRELRFLLQTALDPYLTYGVKKIKPSKVNMTSIDTISMNGLLDLRDALASRKITGNGARDLLSSAVSSDDPTVTKVLVSVFEKSLRSGISTKSVNKVFPDLVRTFDLQLARAISEKDKLDGKWCISAKLNGFRCLMFFEGGKFTKVLSRNGKPLYNCDHIAQSIEKLLEFKGLKLDCVFDGELMSPTWNETASIARASKSDRSAKPSFYIFDFVAMDDWASKSCDADLKTRLDILSSIFGDHTEYVEVLEHFPISSQEEAWEFAAEKVSLGLEGAVAKNLEAPYEYEKNSNWLKVKFTDTLDLPIIDVLEGREKGKYQGTLGSFVCRLENGNAVNVGTGISDTQRDYFWSVRDSLIGKMIEVRYSDITLDGSLLFPKFERFRDDKN